MINVMKMIWLVKDNMKNSEFEIWKQSQINTCTLEIE